MISIKDLSSYNTELYKGLSLNQLVVYTIYFMQSNGIPVTFENITVILFKLFPKKFHMIGYEEYPDATRVNRALLQLRPKYRNWALGDVKKGFNLTKTGELVARETHELLTGKNNQSTFVKNKNKDNERTRLQDEDIQIIEKSKLFSKYTEAKYDEIQSIDLYDMLGAYPQSPPKALRNRLNDLLKQAKYLNKENIQKFIEWAKKRFVKILSDDTP